jgi:hypothetical protein
MAISNASIEKQKPNLNQFIERNNNILNEFLDIYKQDKQPSYEEASGTSIPYVFNLLGSWLLNPSTVSISTFQRISYTDSVISSSLEYNTSIISNTVGEYYHPNKEIEKFVRKCFDKLEEGKTGLIRDMLTAMWSGFYTGEKIYSRPSEFIDGKIWIKQVIPYPPSTVLFRVNRVGQLDDYIYQYVYYALNPGIQNSLSYLVPGQPLGTGDVEFPNNYGTNFPDALSFTGDFDYPIRTTNIQTVGMIPISRKKIIHYVRKGQDGFLNPYGRSMLRSAYNFYVLKCAFLQFLAIAGDRKSTPLLIMYVDPNALTTRSDSNPANPDPILNNPQATQNAIDSVRQTLNALRGDSALILPGMKAQAFDVDVADIQGNLNIFTDTLKYLDDSMQQSLLIPASMFGSGSGQSYALGTSQSSIHNKLLSSIRNSVSRTLIQDYVKDLIEMNFSNREYGDDLGYFESELMNTEDKINVVKLYESMRNSGLTSSKMKDDIDKYRQLVGESELTDEEFRQLEESQEEMLKTKDTTNKTDVKSNDKHYKKRTDIPVGGSAQ